MRSFRYAWVGIPLTLWLLPAAAQNGDDDAEQASLDRGPERCITLNRLERTDVIDDRTLIFHMRDGSIYLNNLSRECPGLEREERFMYSPTGNRLCDIDTVTVLEDSGFGLTRGFTCSLGKFHPISDADLAELERATDEVGDTEGGGDIEVEPVDPDELEEILNDEAPADDDTAEE